MRLMLKIAFSTLLILLCFVAVSAQDQPSSAWATDVGSRYWVQPDIVYQGANNSLLKLDVWYQHDVKTPSPTLVYFHGGGWIFGTKEGSVLQFLPFLEKGWTVVNVEYRMASNSLAPAAVADTRCALRWVYRNTAQWRFDTSKIVLMGHSAGGHLSLITGMLPEGTGLDNQCYGEEKLNVAAIINWYGIADVNDLIKGGNLKNYAVMWMGSQPNAEEIARRVVPYSQSLRLHEALDKAKVPNQLLTIKGGGHGAFPQIDYVRSYETIWTFLRQNKIIQ